MAAQAKISEIAQHLTVELLKKAGIDAQVDVEESEDTIKVNIIGEDLGILIGFHGETLKALQIILGVLINRDMGSEVWYRVLVDVGNWRASRQSSIEEMARKAVGQVKETGETVSLPPMSPDERRLVHLMIQEETDIVSHSEGEGSYRHIVLSLK